MESHHLWAQESCIDIADKPSVRFLDGSQVDPNKDIPCIRMEIEDHRETLSHGYSGHAGEIYRDTQRSFMAQNAFQTAFYMEAEHILKDKAFQENGLSKYVQEVALAEKKLLELERDKKITLDEELKRNIAERLNALREIELKEYKLNEERQQQLREGDIELSREKQSIEIEYAKAAEKNRISEIEDLKRQQEAKDQEIEKVKIEKERINDIEKRIEKELGEQKLKEELEKLKALRQEELRQKLLEERNRLEQSLLKEIEGRRQEVRERLEAQSHIYQERNHSFTSFQRVNQLQQKYSQYQRYYRHH